MKYHISVKYYYCVFKIFFCNIVNSYTFKDHSFQKKS